MPSVQVICDSVPLQPDTLSGSEFPPVPKVTLVPYARLTSLEGVDGSGAFDLPQAESITKASAAASGAGNVTAATDVFFNIHKILNALITDKSPAGMDRSSLLHF